ncbi:MULTISPECIES: TolC family outer membrane protein [Dyella]|uniref:TolC family outer membrane protein n=1 Tax=Dyella TaxID=231454 RepID=UPI000C855718|nr:MULTISPECIES: TolC family outer membrane protein [Dyella]MDR3446435.1 TolC family outer membrane protein [Dyella sp.]PMQ07468.1 Outer membrane protein TolC [Dyella sp. AD56]ULU25501.1 TolC family outer membrane protein [Dyella terrae]
MRLKLLTLALALSAFPLAGHSEDLLDAYREARANDPVLSQAEATRLAIGEGVTQARALMLPQLNGSFGLTQQSTGSQSSNGLIVSDTGHSRTRSVSATLTQSIVDLSQWANLSAAKSQASSQDSAYDASLQNLYVRVTTAYFGVLTSQDALVFAKANEDAYKEAYDQADQRFKVGLSAITDVYQAKSYYELAKAQTISAQNTLNDAREALTQITGKPVGDLKKLREDLPLTPPNPADPNTWVQAALQSNATIQSNQYTVQAAEHSIDAARAGHLPTLDASVQRGKSTSWFEQASAAGLRGNGQYGTTVGLSVNIPIFSGGATQSKVRQSIYQRDEAQDSLESTRRQVVRDTLNYYRSVIAGISQVEANKASVDSGQKALEATRAGFDVGTQTMLNVLNAIQTLTQAESSYSQSRHQLVLDQLELKQSAGSIDVKDMELVNTMLQ